MRKENQAIKILLLGYGTLALSLFKALLNTPDCQIVGLFHCSGIIGTKFTLSSADKQLLHLCKRHRISRIRCPGSNSSEFMQTLQRLKPDLVLISNWGEILKENILSTADVRFVNCHPSLLPAHRGANPYASVIRQGEHETGVTFHQVDPGVDSGAIWLQQRLPVLPDDTGASLRVRCTELATVMIPHLLERLSDGSTPVQQSTLGEASYYPRLQLEDGLIDWQRPAQQIYDNIRGLNPWILSYCYLDSWLGHLRLTTKSAVLRTKTDAVASPGMIIENDNDTLWVATQTAEKIIGLRDVHLENFNGLRGVLLRPGRQLLSATSLPSQNI